MEQWKLIAAAPNYEVSSLGNVRRLTRGRHTRPGLVRKPRAMRGYQYISLHVAGRLRVFQVHRLVMEAFHGHSNLQVNHINGDRADNRLENLEYVTPSANQRHSRDVLRTMPQGEKHHNAKLTKGLVLRIFELRANGLTTYQIATAIGCTATNVGYVLKRKAWAHVEVPPTLLSVVR